MRHPALDAEFPPLKALAERSTNLPAQTSELVGRERELGEIRNLLADRSVRLISLVGPGGIGKTTLAVQIGIEQGDRSTAAVCFVDLSPVTDTAEAFDAIARAIGAAGTGDPFDIVRAHLAPLRMLLVLDNVEQVIMLPATSQSSCR